MESESFELKGLDAIMKKLGALKGAPRSKAAKFALRKGAKIVMKAAQVKADRFDDPLTPENVSLNVDIRFGSRYYKATGDLMYRVGVKGGAVLADKSKDEAANQPTPYWRLKEFGVPSLGIPAEPFMRPALEENIELVTNTFMSEFNKKIDRIIKRGS